LEETKKIRREERKRGEKLAKGEEISPCGRSTS